MQTTDPIVETKAFLSRAGFWPKSPLGIDSAAWLDNFLPDEREVARALLDSFIYLNDDVTNQLLLSAFRDISSLLHVDVDIHGQPESIETIWASFLNAAIITYPTGEKPNPSDSGHLFARKARQLFDFGQEQILEPAEANEVLTRDPSRPIVFVDDFAGSGNQFIETWNRTYSNTSKSFSIISSEHNATMFYVLPIITAQARNRFANEAPSVHVCAAHTISDRYSVLHEHSVVMPNSLRATAKDIISNASVRAGISDDMALGFAELGLCLAFSHSVPDATLPLFWHESPTWKPLVKRS